MLLEENSPLNLERKDKKLQKSKESLQMPEYQEKDFTEYINKQNMENFLFFMTFGHILALL